MGRSRVVYPHEALDGERLGAWAAARPGAMSAGLLAAVAARRFFRADGFRIGHPDMESLRASGAVLDGVEVQYSANFVDFMRREDDPVAFEEACLRGEIREVVVRLRDRKANMLHLLETHPAHPTMIRWLARGWAQRLDDVLDALSEITEE
jgi:hypothetical protein